MLFSSKTLIIYYVLTHHYFHVASTLTAMESWIIGALVFVFFALIEYGLVLRVMSASKEKAQEIEGDAKVKKRHRTLIRALQVWQSKTQRNNEINSEASLAPSATHNNTATAHASASGELLPPEEETKLIEETARKKGQRLDKIALLVLPGLYIIFNIVYWSKYMF